MMRLEKLLAAVAARGKDDCLVIKGVTYSFDELEQQRQIWLKILDDKAIRGGMVIGLQADYSLAAVSLLLALSTRRCIVALVPNNAVDLQVYIEDGAIEHLVCLRSDEEAHWQTGQPASSHPLLEQLRQSDSAGFIIFSSGSSGKPKAVVHSLERFLSKFDEPGKRMRTISFLIFDHIAGVDTLFYTLCSGGALIIPETRDPRSICRLIQNHQVEVLPTSPTFLNLLAVSGDYRDFDLSSLKIITYGSEPMSQHTLQRLTEIFPAVKIIQKYGTSEFGAPRTLSRGNDSLWLKPKQDELEVKIIDDILWVRSQTAMLGYLNVDSPFDEHGWYCTGDRVEQDGEWIHILGRESELIIIGGEKVYPQEVEATILELDFVQDALVKGESHPLTGQIVAANVNVNQQALVGQDNKAVVKAIRKHCRGRLAPYKVPIKIDISAEPLANERQKKIRR